MELIPNFKPLQGKIGPKSSLSDVITVREPKAEVASLPPPPPPADPATAYSVY